jgi:hypothetical protein
MDFKLLSKIPGHVQCESLFFWPWWRGIVVTETVSGTEDPGFESGLVVTRENIGLLLC